ncbi:hypothetical protein SESI111939_13550 [Serratia silvae]
MVQWWANYLSANQHKHVTPYDFAKEIIEVLKHTAKK